MKSLHHSFDIDLAAEYGIDGAIMIHHFQHWIRINGKKNINFKEGRTWSYQTLQDIADHFPYWTVEEVRTIIDRLCLGHNRRSKKEKEFQPVLLKGNFNKNPFDKTLWYAFFDESKFLNSNNLYERANAQIGEGECPNPEGQMPRSIPDTKTDTKTNPLLHPPTPLRPQKQPENFDQMKKKILSSGWNEDEFEEAWRRYLLEPQGRIIHVRRWLESTLQSIRDSRSKEVALKAKQKEEEYKKREIEEAELARKQEHEKELKSLVDKNKAFAENIEENQYLKKEKNGLKLYGDIWNGFCIAYDEKEFVKIISGHLKWIKDNEGEKSGS